jgi:hypothetical protein
LLERVLALLRGRLGISQKLASFIRKLQNQSGTFDGFEWNQATVKQERQEMEEPQRKRVKLESSWSQDELALLESIETETIHDEPIVVYSPPNTLQGRRTANMIKQAAQKNHHKRAKSQNRWSEEEVALMESAKIENPKLSWDQVVDIVNKEFAKGKTADSARRRYRILPASGVQISSWTEGIEI